MYNIRQIKKLTWLQACFLGNVEVIWCNSLGDSLFQTLCDEFCRLCGWFLFTYHLTCISSFASCKHYTSYSLLNFVHVIVCVFSWTNQVWKFLEFYAKHIWCLREWIENLNFGKTGFKTCVFEKHFISYSCMWFIKFNTLRSFCIILLCFSKNYFFPEFWPIEFVFRLIEIAIKNVCESLSVSIGARLVLDQSKHFRLIESVF